MSEITIPKNSRLFHGTGEPFPIHSAEDLQPGGDGVFWTAKDSAIAQTYIPESGSTSHLRGNLFTQPSCNRGDAIHWLQNQAGLEFGNVQWKGGRADSYSILRHPCPPTFPTDPEEYWKDQERSKQELHQIFTGILTKLGYAPENQAYETNPDYFRWAIKTHSEESENLGREKERNDVVKPADWRLPGRLVILTTTRTIRLKRISEGNESCLLDPDHRKLDKFEAAKTAGYDGVLINDFAQTEDGNLEHQSVGLFTPNALCMETIISATHPEKFYLNHQAKSDYASEFKFWVSTKTKPDHEKAPTNQPASH